MADRNYGAIRRAAQFQQFAERIIKANKKFGFDIESGYHGPDRPGTALQMFHPNWIFAGFSFTNSTEWARYVPIGHDNGDNVDDPVEVARWLWKMLRTGNAVAHNAPFELKGTRIWFLKMLSDDPELGEEVRAADGLWPIFSDTQVECFLSAKYHPLAVGQDLKSLTLHVFDHQMIKFAELWPPLKNGKAAPTKKQRFNTLELTPKVITYACEDSVWCLALHLHEDHYSALKDSIVYKTEIALIPVLVDMEIEALALDWAQIESKADEVERVRLLMNEEIQQELSDRLGRPISINLNAPAQLAKILFEPAPEGLGLNSTLKTDGGAESTNDKALGNIAKSDSVVRAILKYRTVVKLYGSYLDKFRKELRYAPDDRAHANHKQTGAGTGRMSVDGLSYQQWPKPYHFELKDGTTFDLNFRNLLVSPQNYRIIGFDYSQVELRVLAGQAGETALLKAFAEGIDIHKATASNMMGIPLEEVTKKIRGKGKTLNFAVVYGSGAENIANMLTSPDDPVTTEDAEDLLEKYFAAFPELKKWMDARVVEGREQGFVTNLFGRKFTVWEYQDHRNWIRSKGDRLCVNAPIQGGAADYCKIAMVRADKAVKKAEAEGKIPVGSVKMVMMVHDALEWYVRDDVDTQTVVDVLGPAVSYHVPGLPEIRADWHEAKRWGEPVEIQRDEAGQITGYAIEDVEATFATVQEAYDYYVTQAQVEETVNEAMEHLEEEKIPEAELPPTDAVLTLPEMPDENQWALFLAFMEKRASQGSTISLVTPEGPLEIADVRLTPDDQPTVSALLGGAFLTFSSSVAVDLMEGVEL